MVYYVEVLFSAVHITHQLAAVLLYGCASIQSEIQADSATSTWVMLVSWQGQKSDANAT